MKRKIKVFIEWLELFALSFGSIFFYVYILACIWLLKRARNYSGDSALPPTLKSVQNRCEILKISELKNRIEKRTPGGFKKFCNWGVDIF